MGADKMVGGPPPFQMGEQVWRVQRFKVVDNSDVCLSCLTGPFDAPYDKETVSGTHFKQRGS